MDIWKTLQTGEGLEELPQQFMELDSTFKFKCRKCGKCCKNQNTILFSPWDVFKIAKKIGKTPAAVIKDYTEVYIGPQSRIPVVHLLMQGRKNACPFLSEEGRCSIHDAKPTVNSTRWQPAFLLPKQSKTSSSQQNNIVRTFRTI